MIASQTKNGTDPRGVGAAFVTSDADRDLLHRLLAEALAER